MVRTTYSALAAFTILLAAGCAEGATILTANITNAAELPPTVPTTATGAPRPASFGNASFVLNDAMTAMTMSVTIFNIDFTGSQTADVNDNLAAAHIHAAPNATTVNAPVVWGFFGAPLNDTNPNDVVVTPFTTGVGGTITGKWDAAEGNNTTLTAQLNNILAGNSYINFHTTQFAGGETRGFLQVTPEPSTNLLIGFGMAGLLGLGAYRRRRAAATIRG